MSGLSPARRLRSKTSDLGDFLRGGHSPHLARHAQDDGELASASVSTLSNELVEVPEALSAPKRKSSRIPFLGRVRKKSSHTDAPPTIQASRESESHSNQPMSPLSSHFDDQLDAIPNSPSYPPPSDSLPQIPVAVSPPSFGSKLAARFTPSKTKVLNRSPHRSSRTLAYSGNTSDTLSPPSRSTRASSFESTSSGGSRQSRSTTPRPTQPTITVSLSPDTGDQYEDLFTRPHHQSAAQSPPPSRDIRGSQSSIDLGMSFPSSKIESATRNDIAMNSESRQRPLGHDSVDEDGSRRSSRSAQSHPESIRKHMEGVLRTGSDFDVSSADESGRASTSSRPRTLSEKRRTITYKSTDRGPASPTLATRSAFLEGPSQPPSIPLPSPPSTTPPLNFLPSLDPLPPRKSLGHAPSSSVSHRPRAHTLSSISADRPPAPSLISTGSSLRRNKPGLPDKKATEEKSDKENLDLEQASAEQLRQALKSRNQQFDELASYMQKLTEIHAAEKSALEKKVAYMEREAARRDKEIKGLTWLVVNNKGQENGGISVASSGAASKSMNSLLDHSDDRSTTPSSSSRLPFYRRLRSEDSGAESYSQTSGAESVIGSGTTSGGESSSSFRVKKVKRNRLVEPRSDFGRVASFKQSGNQPPPPDLPNLPVRPKRSSISSVTSAGSMSSMLPPSPNPMSGGKSLSAIPETPPPPLPPKSYKDPAIAAAIHTAEVLREKEERKASRSSHRLSAPSLVSPSPTPAAAYAANLRRGRPPSIAQVLNQSGSVENLLDTFRPLGNNAPMSSR